MSGRRTLILGGVRSGKSRLAERLAGGSGLAVTYVATATAGDAAMNARIATHRARRPAQWRLVEEPLHLPGALEREAGVDRCLLVDCLTLWLTNLLLQENERFLAQQRDALLQCLPRLPGRIVMVSNETGMGIMPMGDLSRRYCDEAGHLHQELAQLCDQVVLTVAGLPWVLKGEPM